MVMANGKAPSPNSDPSRGTKIERIMINSIRN
jgi:hypothetical protein